MASAVCVWLPDAGGLASRRLDANMEWQIYPKRARSEGGAVLLVRAAFGKRPGGVKMPFQIRTKRTPRSLDARALQSHMPIC